jgi:hypothetical protein
VAEGSRDISGLSSGEVRVSGRASANQAQVQAVARGTSYRIREGVKAVIGQVLRMFRWALLPGNAWETWGRDLVADLPAVYPLGPQPHSEPGLAQDGRGRAMR